MLLFYGTLGIAEDRGTGPADVRVRPGGNSVGNAHYLVAIRWAMPTLRANWVTNRWAMPTLLEATT